jgi:hypothetical protein
VIGVELWFDFNSPSKVSAQIYEYLQKLMFGLLIGSLGKSTPYATSIPRTSDTSIAESLLRY